MLTPELEQWKATIANHARSYGLDFFKTIFKSDRASSWSRMVKFGSQPMARAYFLTAGDRDGWENGVRVMPIEAFLKNIGAELAADNLK